MEFWKTRESWPLVGRINYEHENPFAAVEEGESQSQKLLKYIVSRKLEYFQNCERGAQYYPIK